jgi:hypothetical protein
MTRAERRARTERIVARRMRETASNSPDFATQHGVRNSARHKHPLSCGNSRCWLCHGDKILGRPKPTYDRRDCSDGD